MTVSYLWDDDTWPLPKVRATLDGFSKLSIILTHVAMCQEWSAAAVTHVTHAVPICDRSGPHVPVMSAPPPRAAALFKLKMCYSRPPSRSLSLRPHTVKFPQSLLDGDRTFLHNSQRPRENYREWPLTKMQAQKSGVTRDPHPWHWLLQNANDFPQLQDQHRTELPRGSSCLWTSLQSHYHWEY